MQEMSKKYLNLFVLAGLSLLSLVGCQKDGQGVTLKAKISPVANGADKLYIDGFSTYWTSGDAVFVNDQSYELNVSTNGSATIEGVTGSSPYAAVYPSSIVNSDQSVSAGSQVNITLPTTQEYREEGDKQIVSVPMAAYTTGTTLDFYNLCSVVKVDVTNSTGAAFSLNRITITAADAHLAGAGVLTIASNGNSNIAMSEGATSSVSLDFGNTPDVLSANANKSYYLVLPAFDQTTIDIVLNTTSGEYSYQKTNSLPSNTIAKLDLTVAAAQEPPMSGEFTINDTGGKVRFALGNLQYSTSGTHATADGNNTNGTWRFAEHQYDASATGWTCSFQWGTSGYYGRYPGTNVVPDMNSNYDWGKYNAISNGGTTVGYWRTLTKDEWEYLLTRRQNNRFIKSTVNGVTGVLLFPDGFAWPNGITFPGSGYFNNAQKPYSSLVLSAEQFQQFEQAGCVFLPATQSYYWTSSQGTSTNERYLVYFATPGSQTTFQYFSWSYTTSCFVRLVHAL